MVSSSVQIDPLNSPYPVPWGWVMAGLAEGKNRIYPTLRYYRSPSLRSPDGEWAAYSRIQMHLSPDFTQCRVASVLFLENLQTGNLQTITASSPLADNPFMTTTDAQQPGTIAILVPIAWSETGDRILAREFESIVGSSIASDFAVVWERSSGQVHTIAPRGIHYTNAILLGWSQVQPDSALFQAGCMGEENWPLYAVNTQGQTVYNRVDQPMTFGQVVDSIWAGPQSA